MENEPIAVNSKAIKTKPIFSSSHTKIIAKNIRNAIDIVAKAAPIRAI